MNIKNPTTMKENTNMLKKISILRLINPIFIATLASASNVSLSGSVLGMDLIGKQGVKISLNLQDTTIEAITGNDGSWTINSDYTGILTSAKNHKQTKQLANIIQNNHHLIINYRDFGIDGRFIKKSVDSDPKSRLARIASFESIDTIKYSFSGSIFLRDTISDLQRKGIVRIYDTTANPAIIYGSLIDERDNKIYRTIAIDSQVWMAQNLNFTPANGTTWCYNNTPSNCNNLGALYDWTTALGVSTLYNNATWNSATLPINVCPSGWHLPSTKEWVILKSSIESKVGVGTGNSGVALKALKSWYTANGRDVVGFGALPAGSYQGGPFSFLGNFSYFWTSTEIDNNTAYSMSLSFNSTELSETNPYKKYGCSIRCIQNPTNTVTPPAAPDYNIHSGSFSSPQAIILSSQTKFSNIHYTLDGSTPTALSKIFSTQILIDSTVTIQSLSELNGIVSEITANKYQFSDNSLTKRFTDARDGKSYKYVKIGTQTWMAQNLNYLPISGISECAGTSEQNCEIFGRKYDWATAMGISATYNSQKKGGSDLNSQGVCPAGWRIPSKSDWDLLTRSTIDSSLSGINLKANSTLWRFNSGMDSYGFSVIPTSDKGIASIGPDDIASFWSATEDSVSASIIANAQSFWGSNNQSSHMSGGKTALLAVRCIQ